ncbi:MAG: cytochrome C [Gemmatimonadota bacterium]
MKRPGGGVGLAAVAGLALACQPVDAGGTAATGEPAAVAAPHVVAATPEEAGEYLVLVSGCNDCHTPGWMQNGGQVEESGWLTGVPVGWRGPWGTTYAANLRLTAQNLTEDAWVERLRAGAGRPPMPWMNAKHFDEGDMRALYRFIRSLGPAGEPMPDAVPPDVEPSTPYMLMVPQGGGASGAGD